MTTHTHRKLYRSQDDRILAGVCGGLAEYFDIDPVLIRIVFVVFSMGGMGLFAYIILALIIPTKEHGAHIRPNASGKASEFVEEAADKVKEVFHDISENTKEQSHGSRGRNFIGAIIIGVGLLALLHQVFPAFWFGWRMAWPLVLVLIGFWIIKSRD
ncbi:MAG: PspC domain-containing protein [Patescibacteria group bacterium]